MLNLTPEEQVIEGSTIMNRALLASITKGDKS